MTESNLTNVTSTGVYTAGSSSGYYIVAEESEKYITDPLIFAGYALTASYKPEVAPTCGPGESFFYGFKLYNAAGFYDTNSTPEAADRRIYIGAGVPSNPRISLGADPTDDVVFVTTSDGEVLSLEPPPRPAPESSLIYWSQEY